MERADLLAAAGTAFGEYSDGATFAQPRQHFVKHAAEGFLAAALVIDGFAHGREPADHRPAGDFALGDEAHHPVAVQRGDINPADVVGDEHHRAGQRRADAAHAETEDPQQAALPPADHAVTEAVIADTNATERRRHQDQGDRQMHQRMPRQHRRTHGITQQPGGARSGGGIGHDATIPKRIRALNHVGCRAVREGSGRGIRRVARSRRGSAARRRSGDRSRLRCGFPRLGCGCRRAAAARCR